MKGKIDVKILIYGLGKEALLVKEALKKEHVIVGFTDSFAKIKSYANFPFYDKKDLKKINFDYIILALNNKNTAESVRGKLIGGIAAERIIDFRQLFTWQKVDKVMRGSKNEKIDGVILGISHALLGVNPAYLSGNWRNLAVSGEDLYYHYKTLEKCADCYSDMIGHLKYVVIDMYDYTIFNYDTSLTKNILEYWSGGGYAEDLHHFTENKNYSDNHIEEMKKAGFYTSIVGEKDFQFAEQLFDMDIIENNIDHINNTHVGIGFRDYPLLSRLDKIIEEEPLFPCDLFYMGEERYPETIEENKEILNKLINLLKSINPKIKIYFILMPRYDRLEKYHEFLLNSYKKEFENIMDDVLREDNCYYFNFKQCGEINSNRYFFWDAAHLNYMGAIAFTGMLDDRIKETL